MRRTTKGKTVAIVALITLAGAACSEADDTSSAGRTAPDNSRCSEMSLVECARRSSLGPLIEGTPQPALGDPIVIGMVNQENTAGGSYPELSAAAQAAVEFINTDLGGIDGRPIELDVCNTEFSAEGSTNCAQRFVEARVPAVLGGIDVFGNAIDVLAANDIAYVGGIPVSTQSVTATNSFQWSGGTWGAAVAFADDATRVRKAKRVALIYGDFGSIADAAHYGETVLKRGGADVTLVPYPILSTDLSAAFSAAAGSSPDAVIVLAADAGCRAGFDGLASLPETTTRYFTGACAVPAITEAAGIDKTEGVIFNVEGTLDRAKPTPDQSLYDEVIAEYGADMLDPISAGTVTFRSTMNLYRVLVELDGDVSPSAISTKLAAQVDTPNFNGHPSTCDRKQFGGLPAMCAPQQVLVTMHKGLLDASDEWIDVGGVYAG